MTHLPFLQELVIVAAAGVVAALFLRLLRLPAVAGLLLAGAAAGPSGLNLVHDVHVIDVLAEIGVIFLLFTIGLEFSLSKLKSIARLLAVGGTLQVGLTIAAVTGLAVAIGDTLQRGVFFGFIAALSSTAIVLRGLTERRELDAPHGRLIVGALIFQDLCIVPMMLVLPILAGQGGPSPLLDIGLALGKAAVLVLVVVLVARFLVPRLFEKVDATRSREVFLLAVMVVCIGTAYLTSLVGLSLALGAFLAGVVLAESDFGTRALADVLPLRDLFSALFFVSLGMLFDVHALFDRPGMVLILFAGLFLAKGLLATLSVLPMKPPLRVAVLAGVGLAQFGEFGFVLTKVGQGLNLLTADESRLLLTAGVLTMFVTPLAMRLAPTLAAGAARLHKLSQLLGIEDIAGVDEGGHAKLSNHVVIGGYGVAGRVLGKALASANVPYIVLELNAERVKEVRAENVPIYYGDVSSEEALVHAHVPEAKALVLLINDPDAARRALHAARRCAPDTPIFLRTHYASDRELLLAAGATDVVCEEVESGVEMLARVLRRMGMARNVVTEALRSARSETSPSARDVTLPRPRFDAVKDLEALKVESFLVRAHDHAGGRSPQQMHLRSETGALVVAVRRGEAMLENPPSSEPFQVGDVLYLMGPGPALSRAVALLQHGTSASVPPNAA